MRQSREHDNPKLKINRNQRLLDGRTEMKHMRRDIKNPLYARINISKDEAQLPFSTKSVTDVPNAEKRHNRNLYGL